jgi:hypothetical protein
MLASLNDERLACSNVERLAALGWTGLRLIGSGQSAIVYRARSSVLPSCSLSGSGPGTSGSCPLDQHQALFDLNGERRKLNDETEERRGVLCVAFALRSR